MNSKAYSQLANMTLDEFRAQHPEVTSEEVLGALYDDRLTALVEDTTPTIEAIRVSPFERDHQCEHIDGTVQCEGRAAAWTIPNGSGYIVGCMAHAQELLDDAVAEGDIYDSSKEHAS